MYLHSVKANSGISQHIEQFKHHEIDQPIDCVYCLHTPSLSLMSSLSLTPLPFRNWLSTHKIRLNMADSNCLHSQIGRQTFFMQYMQCIHMFFKAKTEACSNTICSPFACVQIRGNELMAKIINSIIIYIFLYKQINLVPGGVCVFCTHCGVFTIEFPLITVARQCAIIPFGK